MKRIHLAAAAAFAATLGVTSAQAATATGQFNVQMTITAECRVASANDLSFGSNGIWLANVDASSTFQVQCTNGTPYQIGLDLGGNADGSTRRMKHSTANEFVNYELYTDSGRSTVWGNTVDTDTLRSQTGSGSNQTLTVYGRVPVQPVSTPGAYSDLITITVTY
jgi:spore coat protein U-like protein